MPQEYLLNEAHPGEWLFTDKKPLDPSNLAMDIVKAACLDYLPDEVPYKLKFKLNYFENYEGKLYPLTVTYTDIIN